MLFHNIDHVKEDGLEALSQSASSAFFVASARFLDMLSYVEKLEFPQAAAYGRICVAELKRAETLFLGLSATVEGLKWLRDEVRLVDQALAAFEAGLPRDMPELAQTKAQMVSGAFHQVFRSCAEDIAAFSADLNSVVDSVDRLKESPEKLEYRPVHKLLVNWRLLTIKGQQASTAIALAASVSA